MDSISTASTCAPGRRWPGKRKSEGGEGWGGGALAGEGAAEAGGEGDRVGDRFPSFFLWWLEYALDTEKVKAMSENN